MPYRMMHPDHGFHNCYTKEEVLQHEQHGWTLEEEKKEEVKNEVAETQQNKRQGRPKKAV